MALKHMTFRALASGQRRRPYLDVEYENPETGKSIRTLSLIDTGADSCSLPLNLAEALGFKKVEGRNANIVGVNGGAQAVTFDFNISIPGHQFDDVEITCIDGLRVPLLGTDGFLEHFRLKVNYETQMFSLKNPKRSKKK